MNIFQKILIRREIKKYLSTQRPQEVKPVLDFLKKHRLTYLNYDWYVNYDSRREYPIKKDKDGRYYVEYNSHRMYFKKSWTQKQIVQYLNSLIPEQDIRSPHAYFCNDKKDHYNVVIDAGVAEGMFSLDIIDCADKIYLVECDEEWIEALHKTFEPYKDKVIIVEKYLSDNGGEKTISLSEIMKDECEIDLVKMDIEGFELRALKGAEDMISKIKEYLVCVYHYQDELQDVTDFFEKHGTFFSDVRAGWIFFKHDKEQKYPYLRRGLVHVKKVK